MSTLPSTPSARVGIIPHGAMVLPAAVLLGVVGAQIAAIVVGNGGVFTYTLDDPYIHLALAEGIREGTYGLNLGEFSAPSSSILWTFLLVPWIGSGVEMFVPLVINVAAALATVWVVVQVLADVLGREQRHAVAVTLLTLAFLPLTHLGGLVLNGLEHSLQVLLAVLVVWGLVSEREGTMPRLLPLVLVLGPLVRYEMMAITGPALVFLFWRGHRRAALATGLILGAALAAFSAYLLAHGAGPFPNSVVVKSAVAKEGGSGMLANLAANLKDDQAFGVLGAFLVAAVAALRSRLDRFDRGLAVWAASVAALHLLGGRFGWLGRYEVYAWAALLLALVVVFRTPLRSFIEREPLWKVAVVLLVFIGVVTPRYLAYWQRVPHIAHNVYDQHYQMHRFVTEFWKAPVAANDIGWLSFQSDHYVLDLEGLASNVALANRGGDDAWVGPEARRHGVDLAIVHQHWAGAFPRGWQPVGALVLEGRRVMITDPVMVFYARDASAAERARADLERFRVTLPPGVQLAFDDETTYRLLRP